MTDQTFVQVNTASRVRKALPIGYIVCESGCWEWVGGKSGTGYGCWKVNGKTRRAYRVMYERAKGPVPEGKELDHLCRNRLCVNPDHLEPVTRRENVLRGISPSAVHARKTHCHQGHPFTPENTALWNRKNGTQTRVCRTCRRAKWANRADTINAERRRVYGSR